MPCNFAKLIDTFVDFQRTSSEKERFKKINSLLLCVYRVYTNIPNLYGLVVYSFMDFLGDSVACVRFGTKIQ